MYRFVTNKAPFTLDEVDIYASKVVQESPKRTLRIMCINDQLVFIKQYVKERMTHMATREVIQEIHILLRLQHPRVLDFYGVLEDDDCIYMMYECGNQNLYEYLRASRMDETYVKVNIVKPLLNLIAYTHEMGILHRRINLKSIMQTAPHTWKLAHWKHAIDMARVVPYPDPQQDIHAIGTLVFDLVCYPSDACRRFIAAATTKSTVLDDLLRHTWFAIATRHARSGSLRKSISMGDVELVHYRTNVQKQARDLDKETKCNHNRCTIS